MSCEERPRAWARRHKRAIWIAAAAALVVAAIVVLGGVAGRIGKSHPVDLASLSALTGLEFPASARLVSSAYASYIRANLSAEVHLDGEQLEEFLRAQAPAVDRWDTPGASLSAGPAGSAEGEENWWESEDHASEAGGWFFTIDPPRRHPRSPHQDLKVVDVEVTVRPDGVVVVSILGAGD